MDILCDDFHSISLSLALAKLVAQNCFIVLIHNSL